MSDIMISLEAIEVELANYDITAETTSLEVSMEPLPVSPQDIIEAVSANDDRLFAFIWGIINDERVGIEMRQRLYQQLEIELVEASAHPDYVPLGKEHK